MKKTCSQCHFELIESCKRYAERIRKYLPKLCKDCLRIENAEKNAATRKKKIVPEQLDFRSIENIVRMLSLGMPVTHSVIVRQNKVTFEEAKRILDEAREKIISQA